MKIALDRHVYGLWGVVMGKAGGHTHSWCAVLYEVPGRGYASKCRFVASAPDGEMAEPFRSLCGWRITALPHDTTLTAALWRIRAMALALSDEYQAPVHEALMNWKADPVTFLSELGKQPWLSDVAGRPLFEYREPL